MLRNMNIIKKNVMEEDRRVRFGCWEKLCQGLVVTPKSWD